MKVVLGNYLVVLATVALSLARSINVNKVIHPGDACPLTSDTRCQTLFPPHPTDCRQVLICTDGVFVAKYCYSDYHYNAEACVCQPPTSANCEINVTSNPIDPTNPSSPTNPTEPVETNNPTNPSDPADPTGPTIETTWSPPTTPDGGWTSCPAIDPPGFTIHIQHPNCALYYVCDNGAARERPCPPGLQWNNDDWACDWPNLANCVDGAVLEIPGAIPF